MSLGCHVNLSVVWKKCLSCVSARVSHPHILLQLYPYTATVAGLHHPGTPDGPVASLADVAWIDNEGGDFTDSAR